MYCPRCGHPNPLINRFCGQCGLGLPAGVVNEPPQPTATETQVVGARQPYAAEMQDGANAFSSEAAWAEHGAAQPEAAVSEEGSVHGPSFLGLSDDAPTEDHNLDYLYEYDEPRSGGFVRVVLALLLLAGFGLFIAYELRQNPAMKDVAVAQVNALSERIFGSPLLSSGKPAAQAKPSAAKGSAPVTPPAAAPATAAPAPSESAPGESQSASEQKIPGTIMTVTPDGATSSTTASSTPESGKSAAADQPAQNSTGGADDQDNSGDTNAAAENSKPAAKYSRKDRARRAEVASPKKPSALASADAVSGSDSKSALERQPGEQLYTKGVNYLYGTGVPSNCDQALVYLRNAANMGNAKARGQLGALYATGHCVPMDRATAYGWFSLAADASQGRNIWLERNRDMLWSQMTDKERQRAIASR